MKQFETPETNNLFKDHLTLKGNSRIFFSGKFGSGKTTFLKNFFSQRSLKAGSEDYQVFHLFPRKYQVGENKDVFEYIKFDLLYLLMLEEDLDFESLKLPLEFKVLDFTLKNADEILIPFLNFVPEVGVPLFKIADKLNRLRKGYRDYHNEVEFNDKEKAFDYLQNFNESMNGPYEDDFYSQLIRQLIAQLKVRGKSPIMVIDDLERLDPDHLFRLLNIFDAHVDQDVDQNKFGFEKIILVGDVRNIKAIFHQKFGNGADFLGYINKFYSKGVYHFDIRKAFETSIAEILKDKKFIYFSSEKSFVNPREQDILTANIYYILIAFIRAGEITVRELEEKLSLDYEVSMKNLIGDKLKANPSSALKSYTAGYPGIVLLEFFSYIFEDDLSHFESALLKCKDYEPLNQGFNLFDFLIIILPIIDYSKNGFKNKFTERSSLELNNELGKFDISYFQSTLNFGGQQVVVGEIETNTSPHNLKFNYFEQLQKAFFVCKENSFIAN